MRFALTVAALVLTSGCAIFAPTREARLDARAERTVIEADGALEPVSVTAPRLASGAPIGLTPCKKKSFPARDCWRRGDQHIIFPPSIATAGMPAITTESIPVADKR